MSRGLPGKAPVLAGFSYIRALGSGGFADVFLYEQNMPRRQVAVKVLPAGGMAPEVRRMFNAEADILARLSSHPSILTVYQASISADGRPYIVMEYCPGSIGDRYRREKMPVREVLDIGVRMSSALEAAHCAGLLHRDVKPSNILITEFGLPVLSDFGIASSMTSGTGDQLYALSVPWSAPEVIDEKTTGTVASEVWSLGATIYSLLAGRSPFERVGQGQNSPQQLQRRILRADYPPIGRRDVPASLEQVLMTTMRRQPEARYQHAVEVGQALQNVQTELGLPATPIEVPSQAWSANAAQISFADEGLRGVVRPSVEYATMRKSRPAGPAGASSRSSRSATRVAEPERRGKALWALLGAGVAVVVVLGVVGILMLTGVI